MLQERAQYVGTGKADVDNWGIESDEEEEAKPSKSKAKPAKVLLLMPHTASSVRPHTLVGQGLHATLVAEGRIHWLHLLQAKGMWDTLKLLAGGSRELTQAYID